MCAEPPVVVHLVAADTLAERTAALRWLAAPGGCETAGLILHCGPGICPVRGGFPVGRVHAVAPLARLRAAALGRTLHRHWPVAADRPLVLHAWSRTAAEWAQHLCAGHRPLLVQCEATDDPQQYARWARVANVHFVCTSATTQQALGRRGVAWPRLALIRPPVDAVALQTADRAAARAALGFSEADEVVLALPPVARHAGTLVAAWAAFLLEKVRPAVRLIVPAQGAEAGRVRRFAAACRHEWVVRFAPPEVAPADLLAAADLAVFVPPRDTLPGGLACALTAGCPIVASRVPSVLELCDGEPGVWLCRPNDPEDAARQMLRALEHPEQRHARAERARVRAVELFDPARAVDRYRQVYANLAARRPAGAGLS